MQSHEQKAYELLIPHKDNIKSVLNIGFVNLPDASIRIVNALGIDPEFNHLEIFETNCENGKRQYPTHNFILGDVRNIKTLIQRKFDLIIWWHGPEHIYENELVPTITDIESLLNDNGVIILGSPDGWQEQYADDGNVHNDHVSGPDSDFYKSLNYTAYREWAPLWSLIAYKQV
jgi:hypothetical protein